MGGTILACDSEGEALEHEDAVFSHNLHFFQNVKGYMIRAAIAYLEQLQSKPLTKKVLINKGILGSALMDSDPEVVVGLYQARIEEGINLLKQWVREQKPYASPEPTLSGLAGTVQKVNEMEKQYRMMTSVARTGYPHAEWSEDQNFNYYIGAIPKNGVPVVLQRLKMTGLWRYAVAFGELEPTHCREIVDFLNRVMPHFRKQFESGSKANAKAFKRVFELCPEDGSVKQH